MSINGINNVGGAYGASGFGNVDGVALSPESLLAYCQTQVGGLTTEINGFMDAQNAALAKKKLLGNIKNAMAQAKDPGDQTYNDTVKAFADALQNLPAGDPLRDELREVFAEVLGGHPALPFAEGLNAQAAGQAGKPYTPTNLKSLTAEQLIDVAGKLGTTTDDPFFAESHWTGLQGTIGSAIENVSGDASIGMIKLQSLVSQHQMVIQLTTNILAKIDSATQGVIGNIRS